MASPFDAVMMAADSVFGTVFGDEVLVTPRRASSGELKPMAADPERPSRTVTGVFTREGGTDRLGGTRQGTELQGMSTMAVAPARIWFSTETLRDLGYAPVAGDLITLTNKPGRPSYAIARHAPSDLDDGTFPLTTEKTR